MNLKFKHLPWMGNIYQKFEAACQEVDDIVGQDAVKYLENRVQDVGDSMKKFYSDVVQELLPLSPSVNSGKQGVHSVALNNNVGSSFKSIAGIIDDNEKGAEKNPVNNFINSLQDSSAIDPAKDLETHASIKCDLVNQVSDDTSSNSLEEEDSYITQEETDDDDSEETSGAIKENLHVGIEQNVVESTPQLLNLISLKEKEPLEFSILSEPLSGSSDSGSGALAGAKNNSDVNAEQNSCLIVENAMRSFTSEVLNLWAFGEKELIADSLFCEQSDGVTKDSYGVLAEVSPATSVANTISQSSKRAGIIIDNVTDRDQCLSDGSESSDNIVSSEVGCLTVSCARPMVKLEPSCFKSSLISDSLCAKSPRSYSVETESCKNKTVDVAECISDSSMALVSCEPTGKIMASQDGLVSSGSNQSMESNEGETFGIKDIISLNNSSGIRRGQICSAQDRVAIISLSDIDESLVNSIESSMEDIQLSDDAKLEESCVFVDDSELYAVSCRAQRLRSYKKRIRDAFGSKKRLAKEYEQLAIWYGDTDIEPSQGTSRTLFPFSSRRSLDSEIMRVPHECETEWELL